MGYQDVQAGSGQAVEVFRENRVAVEQRQAAGAGLAGSEVCLEFGASAEGWEGLVPGVPDPRLEDAGQSRDANSADGGYVQTEIAQGRRRDCRRRLRFLYRGCRGSSRDLSPACSPGQTPGTAAWPGLSRRAGSASRAGGRRRMGGEVPVRDRRRRGFSRRHSIAACTQRAQARTARSSPWRPTI
jgi:hypothetical protein